MLWRCREDFRFNGEVFISLKQKRPKDPCHMLLARSCLHPTQGQKASLRLSGWSAAIWHCSNVMSNVISQMWKARLMLGDLGAEPLVVFGDVSGVSGRVLCHSVEVWCTAQTPHKACPWWQCSSGCGWVQSFQVRGFTPVLEHPAGKWLTGVLRTVLLLLVGISVHTSKPPGCKPAAL